MPKNMFDVKTTFDEIWGDSIKQLTEGFNDMNFFISKTASVSNAKRWNDTANSRVTLEIDAPGARPETTTVETEPGKLHLSYLRSGENLKFSYKLADHDDLSDAEVKVEHGVVRITWSVKPAGTKRKLKVT